MSATWTVLGAGSILPRAGFGPAGYALRPGDDAAAAVTLFDCGPGSVRSLAACGIELSQVERVVVSHFHPDHCLDLFALAFARRNPQLSQLPPIELIGPRGLGQLLAGGEHSFGRWVRFENSRLIEVEPRAEQRSLSVEGLELSWVATDHTPESLAWRADLPSGESLAFSGDTGPNPVVAELARDVDLFVVECSFPEGQAMGRHLTPRGAAEMARAAGARRLLLTHFYPANDPEQAAREAATLYSGPIETARDGSLHRLGT